MGFDSETMCASSKLPNFGSSGIETNPVAALAIRATAVSRVGCVHTAT
jgi:hypothetical protein